MSDAKLKYNELEKRCRDAEAMLEAILSGRTERLQGEAGTLVVRLAEAEERESHIRRVLTAIRNVNQLIVQEDDPRRLIETAVSTLTETMGYHKAWIAVLDEEGSAAKMTASCGFESGFDVLEERLAGGDFPHCVKRALAEHRTVAIHDPRRECPDCPLAGGHGGCASLAHRLAIGERVFGVLTASIEKQFVDQEHEMGLFEELAGDLAFALRKIKDASALTESRRRYLEVFEGSRDGFVMVDASGKIIDANPAYCRMLGYSLEELKQLEDFYTITPERWREWERDEIWRSRLLRHGYSGVYEKEYIRKDGTVFPVELQAYAVFSQDGMLEYLWGVARDITQQKKTAEAYGRFCQMATELICVADIRTATFVQVNPAFTAVLGYSEAELLGRPFLDFVHPDDREETVAVVERMLHKGVDVVSFENRYRCSDGTYRVLEWNSHPVPEEGLTFAIAHDVTQRKETDQALRDSEEKYRALIMQSADCLILHDLDGNILDVNPWSCNTYGYTRDELLRMKVAHLDPDYDARAAQGFWDHVSPGAPIMFEARQRKRDGTVFPVEVRLSMIELRGRNFILALYRDISERKHAEAVLRESEEKHRRLFETMSQGVVYQAANGRIIDANPAALEILGLSLEQLCGKTSLDPHWKAIREDGSAFPGEEHPSMVALRTGKPVRNVTMGVSHPKENRTVWIIVSAVPLFHPGEKKPYQVYSTFSDITQRRDVEERLRQSEAKFRSLFEHMAAASCVDEVIYDEGKAVDYRILDVNPSFERLMGLSRDEVVGRLASEVYGLEESPFLNICAEVAETEEPAHLEVFFPPIRRYLEVTVSCPKKGGFSTVISDITDRKAAETARRESERRLRTLLGNLPGMAYRCLKMPGWPMEFLSEGCKSLTGHAPEELLAGGNVAYGDLIHVEDRERVSQTIENAVGRREPFEMEYRIRTASGEERWVWERGRDVGTTGENVVVLEGFIADTSDRKRAESALRESELKFRTIFENAPLGMFRSTPEGRFIEVNRALAAMLGYDSPEEVIREIHSIPDQVYIDPGLRERIVDEQLAQSGMSLHLNQYRRRDGSEFTARLYLKTIRDESDRPVYLEGIVEDLSELRAAEAERERLLSAIEQSGEVIVVTDADGNIQYANPAFERVTGYAPQEAIGKNPRFLKSGEQDEEFYRRLWSTICGGNVWQGRFINRRKDGTLYTEDATISPVIGESGDILNYVAVKRDITKELDLEERFRQSQKLEAIGQLAGGVAHDFNNLLLVINGYSEMAFEKLGDGHPARAALEGVMKAGQRAATLVSQLLAFSRRQIMRPEDLDLNEVVGELLKMLARVIGEHIRLDFVPGHRLGTVHADRGMIEQIVMNLCVNARDAMPEGGELMIETENVYINGNYTQTHPWAKPGRFVLLSVGDTGCGMDEETLRRIFEPFFTTKGVGHGTGLGLATVYGIVQQHEGMINAYSEPGKGTTFKVYLPIIERPAAAVGPKLEGRTLGGTETILLAEDDEAVLTIVRQLLERVGYTVLTAINGKEALEVFEERADEISLALLDVVMPEMGGKEVFDCMKRKRPEVRVIFASGYSENAVHTNFVLDESLVLLQKPYDPAALYKAVREALDS